MACINIITEDGKLLIAEDGIELVTEDSVCPGVVTITTVEGYILRPLEFPLRGLNWN